MTMTDIFPKLMFTSFTYIIYLIAVIFLSTFVHFVKKRHTEMVLLLCYLFVFCAEWHNCLWQAYAH